jgi:hypothetical protein
LRRIARTFADLRQHVTPEQAEDFFLILSYMVHVDVIEANVLKFAVLLEIRGGVGPADHRCCHVGGGCETRSLLEMAWQRQKCPSSPANVPRRRRRAAITMEVRVEVLAGASSNDAQGNAWHVPCGTTGT